VILSPSLQTLLPNRVEAGRRLVEPLLKYANRSDVINLALPRGGVPVAYEVATALKVRLDLMLVRKLGVPSHPEYAMGAIASGGIQILNDDAMRVQSIDRAGRGLPLPGSRTEHLDV
jgi:putative phosphoribosyl transferase